MHTIRRSEQSEKLKQSDDETTLTQFMSKPIDSLDSGSSVGSESSSGHGNFCDLSFVRRTVFSSGSSS